MLERPSKTRLQKRIAASGLCSRRKAEELIVCGKVRVNGKVVTELGTKVDDNDSIEVDGKALPKNETITIAFYKPRGVLTSKKDPFHKETVMDLLPAKYRHLNPIGRLDKDSEGLLLLTSDGDLQNRLTHARFGHEKTYHVLVRGMVTKNTIKQIQKGGQILDGYAVRPMGARILKDAKLIETPPDAVLHSTWLELILKEGRKRQIRRVMELLGHPVLRLIRVQVDSVTLSDLKPGEWRLTKPPAFSSRRS